MTQDQLEDDPTNAADRRRRRAGVLAAAGAALAVVVGVSVVAVVVRGEDRDPGSDTSNRVEMAPSPLSPRYGSVGAWTGSELIVVGGADELTCTDEDFEQGNDECGLDDPPYLQDGAAYDPELDTWRPIADAPAPIDLAQAEWSGRDLVVVTLTRATYAYDPTTDRWRTLAKAPPRAELGQPIVTDDGVLFPSYSQGLEGDIRDPDQVLDPRRGRWTPIPRDPFKTSVNRVFAWDGERLWLLSVDAKDYYDGAPFPARLAVLEGGLVDGRWRVVDDATPELQDTQGVWASQGRLVVPPAPGPDGVGRVYDIGSGSWSEIRTTGGGDGCSLPFSDAAGAGPRWVAGAGTVLLDADGDTTVVPTCPGGQRPSVAEWAGDELLVWGGTTDDSPTGTATGYRLTVP